MKSPTSSMLAAIVALPLVAPGCRGSVAPSPLATPPPTGNIIAATWTGSFASGLHGSPLTFTALGQVATLTIEATPYTAGPQEAVSVAGIDSCAAASISEASSSSYTITSLQAGDCTLELSNASDAHLAFQITVP